MSKNDSTISNEERREVAATMRAISASGLRNLTLGEMLNSILTGGAPRPTTEMAILASLADLIEPQPIDGDTSDGYHTFNELYHHRAVLFSVIVAKFADRAWKSKLHADGTMYDGMFIVGIETTEGQATYHYDIDPYWEMFRCREVDRAPEWDGHTPDQAIERIGKLIDYKIDRPTCKTIEHGRPDECHVCKSCSRCSYGWFEDIYDKPYSYCPNCGAEVVSDAS